MKICHITSAHPIDDVRIYHKECLTLNKYGFDIQILGSISWKSIEPKIKYELLKFSTNYLLKRFFYLPFIFYKKAKIINADIYHFHDPELLIVGFLLKRKGKIIIYDIHEDNPRAIIGRDWGNKYLRIIISYFFEKFENIFSKKFDVLLTATNNIYNRFILINKNTITLNNYPQLSEIINLNNKKHQKQKQLCYTGIINQQRGIGYIVKALEKVEIRLLLIGNFSSNDYYNELKNQKGWQNVDYVGYNSREYVNESLVSSIAGIVTFLPLPNHINSQPNKMFEYMSAGVPVIASDFPLWKEIIHNNNCGICVNPTNPDEISTAIQFLINNPDQALKMGENGRKAVIEKYNWEVESEKLLNIYNKFMIIK